MGNFNFRRIPGLLDAARGGSSSPRPQLAAAYTAAVSFVDAQVGR